MFTLKRRSKHCYYVMDGCVYVCQLVYRPNKKAWEVYEAPKHLSAGELHSLLVLIEEAAVEMPSDIEEHRDRLADRIHKVHHIAEDETVPPKIRQRLRRALAILPTEEHRESLRAFGVGGY